MDGDNAGVGGAPNSNPLAPPPTSLVTLPANLQREIILRSDQNQLSTIASVSPTWHSIVNEKIGRTVSLSYHDWVQFHRLHARIHILDFEQYELKMINKLRRHQLGARKIRFHMDQQPMGADSRVAPLAPFVNEELTLESFAASRFLLNFVSTSLRFHIRIASFWSFAMPVLLFPYHGTAFMGGLRWIQHKILFGVAHPHLLESISIQFPPSPILFAVIWSKLSVLKELEFMPQSLEYIGPSVMKNLNIPLLTKLSIRLALNSYRNEKENKMDSALAVLNTNCFPKLKTLRIELGVISHQSPLVGEPILVDQGENLKMMHAVLNFLEKHDGLVELDSPQGFLECDTQYEGLSYTQRFVRLIPGTYCVGEFQREALDAVERRAGEVSVKLSGLRVVRVCQVAKVHGVNVSSCPSFVQKGPQAVLWKAFVEEQKLCENLCLGMPGVRLDLVKSMCQGQRVNLKTLQLTHIMFNGGGETTLNCECFRNCPSLEKLVLGGAPLYFGTRLEFTLDPPLTLTRVREGLPPQLKQLVVSNLKVMSTDAHFILVEMQAIESVQLIRIGTEEQVGVNIDTIRQVVNKRKLKKLVLYGSIRDEIGFQAGIRVNPAELMEIHVVGLPDQRLSWIELVKNGETGHFEQIPLDQFRIDKIIHY